MKFAIFGATGETGQVLVQQCLETGNSLHLLARNPSKVVEKLGNSTVFECQVDSTSDSIPDTSQGGVLVIKGDARNYQDVAATISGLGLRCNCLDGSIPKEVPAKPVDAVASCLGSKHIRGPETTIHSVGTKNIVDAMKQYSVTRLVVESAIGTKYSWDSIPFWAKPASFVFGGIILKEPQQDKDLMEEYIVGNSDKIKYTLVRPPMLYNASRTFTHPSTEKPTASIESVSDGFGYRWGTKVFGFAVSRADVAHFMLRCLTSDLASGQGVNISYY